MDDAPLRPLTLAEILERSVRTVAAEFGGLVAIAAVLLIPVGIVQAVLSGALGSSGLIELAASDATADPEVILAEAGRVFVGALALAVLSIVGFALVQGSTMRIVIGRVLGLPVEWRRALQLGTTRITTLVAVGLLFGIGASLGLVFYILPGVWLYVSWWVAAPVAMLEGTGAPAALGRSFRLVRGRFWQTLGIAVLAFALQFLAQQLIGGLLGIVGILPTGPDASLIPASVAGTAVSLITVPFVATASVLSYLDLRVRTDGYDTEQLTFDTAMLDSGAAP